MCSVLMITRVLHGDLFYFAFGRARRVAQIKRVGLFNRLIRISIDGRWLVLRFFRRALLRRVVNECARLARRKAIWHGATRARRVHVFLRPLFHASVLFRRILGLRYMVIFECVGQWVVDNNVHPISGGRWMMGRECGRVVDVNGEVRGLLLCSSWGAGVLHRTF